MKSLRRMVPLLGALLVGLMIVSFCDAGPLGLFGGRRGGGNCANGQCSINTYGQPKFAEPICTCPDEHQCANGCLAGCVCPVANQRQERLPVSVSVLKPAPVENTTVPPNPEQAVTPTKPLVIERTEQTASRPANADVVAHAGPVRTAAAATATVVGKAAGGVKNAAVRFHNRERFKPVRNLIAHRRGC